MIVIDASVALGWCFEDEASVIGDELLLRVAQEGAVVPPLWCYEVANALSGAERRGRLKLADSLRLATMLTSLRLQVDYDVPSLSHLVDRACGTGLTAYDSAYLSLASSLGLPLATFDRALATAAKTAGVVVLGQP